MENMNQGFTTKKYIAVGLMAIALLMLCMNWIKLGDSAQDVISEYKDEFEHDMEMSMSFYGEEDVEELLEEQGYSSKEIKKIEKCIESFDDLLDTMEEGRFSVFSMISMVGDMADIKPAMSDEDLMGGDEETVMIITVFQVILGVIIVMFALAALFMVLAIVAHMQNKRSLGIPAIIFSVLLFLGMGFIGLILMAGTEDLGSGITLAPVLTLVCTIASCIVWSVARKSIPKEDTF